MVTKAIIEQIIDKYHARVRIPSINKIEGSPSSTPFNELYIASVCCSIGSKPCLKNGDIVFVSFEDNSFDLPVIIGQLFREDSTGISDQYFGTLDVSLTCDLPEETTIGNVTKSDLNNLTGTKANIQGQLDYLKDSINSNIKDLKAYVDKKDSVLDNRITYVENSFLPLYD